MSRRSNERRQHGIKLPLVLRKELGIQNDSRPGNTGKGRGSRGGNKAEGRVLRDRGKRQESFRKDKGHSPDLPSTSIDVEIDDGDLDRQSDDSSSPASLSRSLYQNSSRTAMPSKSIPQKRKTRSHSNSSADSTQLSSPHLTINASSRIYRENLEQDDKDIALLEKRLGLRKRKSQSMGDETLDFLLEGLDGKTETQELRTQGKNWLEAKRRRLQSNQDLESEEDDKAIGQNENEISVSGSSSFSESSELGPESYGSESDEPTTEIVNSKPLQLRSEASREDSDEFEGFDVGKSNVSNIEKTRVRENPYIAPVAANVTPTKYVPPSLRRRNEDDEQSWQRLRKQINGHLNRLSEEKLMTILGEIEKIYRTNPRQDTSTALIDLIIQGRFCVPSAQPNTFIILHGAFIAAMYRVIGTDFGAQLLVRLIEAFNKHYEQATAVGKEAVNLISLLANLFTFGVVSSNIVYDHIRLLLSEFNEVNAELLLRVARDCGPQLRADDPVALKDIVQSIQNTVTEVMKRGETVNVRTRVMIDTITDLKNNKMKNATNAAGVAGEHIVRMRKMLGTLNSRTLKTTEPLRVTRADIANSDKVGKWWLIGASWKGQKPSEMPSTIDDAEITDVSSGTRDSDQDIDLVALAQHHRMNTDVRRSIFVAIMSAEDARDAQMRLSKLRLSSKQEHEIAKVLLRCTQAESSYNPYYTLLARNLCKENRKVKMGFQFSLWDFFRRMGEGRDDDEMEDDGFGDLELHEIVNVAKMYAYLIFHRQQTLGVLKTLDIGMTKEQGTLFLEILLVSIMTQPKATENDLVQVFGETAQTPQVIKPLQYFLRKIRKSDLVSKKDKGLVTQGVRTANTALYRTAARLVLD